MTTQPSRAKWWREVAEGEDIHPGRDTLQRVARATANRQTNEEN